MKDFFVAQKCEFQEELGYMVSQIHDGKTVVEQFIPESSYKAFCKLIGTTPIEEK